MAKKGRKAITKRAGSKPVKGATAAKKAQTPSPVGRPRGAFTLLAAAPTVHVTIVRTRTGGAEVEAKLNTKDLTFTADTAHAIVGRGQPNTLEWAVLGPPPSSYTIAVTDPAGTDCGGGKTLGASGKDSGVCAFHT